MAISETLHWAQRALLLLSVSFLAVAGCGDNTDDASDSGADALDDAGAGDGDTGRGDTGAADSDTDVGDTSASDTESDADTDSGLTPLLPNTCEPSPELAPDAVDTEQSRFALSMFHFNVEYVIGGLEYFDEEKGRLVRFLDLPINAGWDHDRVQDYIVRETLLPMLEMYERHPDWRATFEMQANAVELMAERHPDVLLLMRELSQRGQIELVSFHWAAQLFLAYPLADQLRSLERTRRIFEEYCLPLSEVVFNQEGQAGEGRQRVLVEQGWRIGVFPKNLWRYARGETTPWPWYASEGGILIVGPGDVDPASGVQVTWPFFDDGELAAVAEAMNPYMAPYAPHMPARVEEFEQKLQALDDAGWKITTITDYVHQLQGRDLELPPAPPLLDGTWQPPSTDSIHRWLGGRSQANTADEEDNRVRAGNAVARMHAEAAQVMVEVAAREGLEIGQWEEPLYQMWSHVLRSQISDGSGVNPWRAEVLWCLEENRLATELAEQIRTQVMAALDWPHVQVDLASRSAVEMESLPVAEPPEVIEAPLEVDVRADGREIGMQWTRFGPNISRFHVWFSEASACDGCDTRRIRVDFPRTGTQLAYSPGLIEDQVRIWDEDDFEFLLGEVYLPLANGLIGLGDDLWLVKHNRSNHIAARFAPADPFIRFDDQAVSASGTAWWWFDLVEGSAEEALRHATRTNITPWIWY